MPRKLRTDKRRPVLATIPASLFWHYGDGILYEKPPDYNPFCTIGSDRFGNSLESCWPQVRGMVLADWIEAYPCTRPSFWWTYDAPRATDDELQELGCPLHYYEFEPRPASPRLRLGGVGWCAAEALGVPLVLDRGIPVDWISDFDVDFYRSRDKTFAAAAISAAFPPTYESAAAYLKRHGLLTPNEQEYVRLNPTILTTQEFVRLDGNESKSGGDNK